MGARDGNVEEGEIGEGVKSAKLGVTKCISHGDVMYSMATTWLIIPGCIFESF